MLINTSILSPFLFSNCQIQDYTLNTDKDTLGATCGGCTKSGEIKLIESNGNIQVEGKDAFDALIEKNTSVGDIMYYDNSGATLSPQNVPPTVPGQYIAKVTVTIDSDSYTLEKAFVVPDILRGVSPTSAGGNDGKITGLDSTKQYLYRAVGGTDWQSVQNGSTAILDLEAGDYEVKIEGENPETITVPEYQPPKPKPDPKPEPSPDSETAFDSSQNDSSVKEPKEQLLRSFSDNKSMAKKGDAVRESEKEIGGVCFVVQQGPLCDAAFKAATPNGFKEAFSFNFSVDTSKHHETNYDRKQGLFVLNIPKAYQKKGRTFRIIGINKNGQTRVFADSDMNDDTFTTILDVEGYAFSLIYTDSIVKSDRTNVINSFSSQTGNIYTVQQGDTLYAIAGRLGVTLRELIDKNELSNPDKLSIGQRINY